MFKNLLYISILTAVVTTSWISLSIYHSYTSSTISKDTGIIITPIPAEFDRETMEKINTKKIIRVDLSERVAETSEEKEATPAAQEASPSGQQQL